MTGFYLAPPVRLVPHRPAPRSPAAIANGRGDAFLLGLNQAVAAWGKPIYVRGDAHARA